MNLVQFPVPLWMSIYKNLKSHLIFFPLFLHEMAKHKLRMCLVLFQGQMIIKKNTVEKGLFSKKTKYQRFQFLFHFYHYFHDASMLAREPLVETT